MISHDVEFVAEYADRVGLFFQGNVVTSKPAAEFLQETVSTLLLQTVWRDITFLMQLPERRWLRA